MALFWKSEGRYDLEQNIRKRPDSPMPFMGSSVDVLA